MVVIELVNTYSSHHNALLISTLSSITIRKSLIASNNQAISTKVGILLVLSWVEGIELRIDADVIYSQDPQTDSAVSMCSSDNEYTKVNDFLLHSI